MEKRKWEVDKAITIIIVIIIIHSDILVQLFEIRFSSCVLFGPSKFCFFLQFLTCLVAVFHIVSSFVPLSVSVN